MENHTPFSIHVHLVSGLTRVFHQDNPELVETICNDLDARIFDRSTLIIENGLNAVAFAGHGLLGISIVTDQMPKAISMRESTLRTYVRQISKEIAIGGMGERAEMHHLFTNPSLACRRLGGGFSLWNTSQIMSWSHSPKLESPGTTWKAIEVAEALELPPKVFSLL